MTTKPRRKGTEALPDIALAPPDLAAPPDEAREQLRDVLMQQKLPQLRAIAATRQAPARAGQRETLVAALLDHLLDPAAQAAVLGALTQPARALLAAAVLLDWTRNPVTSADAQRVLRGIGAGAVDQALAQLGDLGLFLPPLNANPRYELARFLPAALVPGLLPLLPEIRAYSGDLPPAAATPADAGAALRDAPALRKLDALLAALQAHEYRSAEPGPRTYRGEPTHLLGRWEVIGEVPQGRFYTRANERPTGVQLATNAPLLAGAGLAQLRAAAGFASDAETAFFLHLALARGLAARAGRVFVVQPADADSPLARLTLLVAAVLALNTWSELDPLLASDPALAVFRNSTLHYMEPLQMRGEVAHIRQAVAALLAWLPVGPWYDLDTFLGALRHLYPELPVSLQPRVGGWEQVTWWLERADGNGGWQYLNRRNSADWQRGLGRLAATALAGPLQWLGLVETTALDGTPLRGERFDLLAGLRLTPLGGLLLSRRPPALRKVQPPPVGAAPRPARGPAVQILGAAGAGPRLHVDPRALPFADQLTLAGFADPLRMDDDLAIYELSAGSVRQGFDAGLDGPALLAFLRRVAGADPPPALAERIAAWWASYGRLRFYTGVSLISFADEFTLTEVLAATSLSKSLLYQFSPRLVAVASADLDRVLAELGRAGHTPRVIDEALPAASPGGAA